MIISFPLLVDQKTEDPSGGKGRTTRFHARALFLPAITASGEFLGQVHGELRRDLQNYFNRERTRSDHGRLEPCTFSPDLFPGRVSGEFHLRRSTFHYDLFTLDFDALGERLCLLPHLSDLLLPLPSGPTRKDLLKEALLRYFRRMEKDQPDDLPKGQLVLGAKAFIDYLDVDISPAGSVVKAPKSGFALFGASIVQNGFEELTTIGKSLTDQWPDGLDRAYFRDVETEQLRKAVQSTNCKPLLLLGKPKTGKTVILHEAIFRIVQERPASKRFEYRNGFWQIHTNRLMAGMSRVGDWQKRLISIVEEAEKENHVLIFDNLAALFHLGKSAGSSLCMADLLKPYLQKHRFRFVGEISEEAFVRLQEIDRGFCDLFEVIRLGELEQEASLRVLIRRQREIEERRRVVLDSSVIPTADALQRRFNREQSRPGSVLSFLTDLAARHTGRAPITRRHVIESFSERSGLSSDFLDPAVSMDREHIRKYLGSEWIGQEQALDVLTDTIVVARAGLQDPHKPLGCFLLLGPTGVGKTECAKGLARYLYGGEDRLLRFDMNEYVSPYAAAQLYGTVEHPDGYLTSAVRHNPFSIVLLDEIEKAHPDVFDVLLQVLGEGRLTDALGRTVDFTNTIVLLTSNLGVGKARHGVGFQRDGFDESRYLQAAQRFFRPEFYNRLDAVIPFRNLSRSEIALIAKRLLSSIFKRSGFLHRHTSVRLSEAAESWLVDLGYDPVFGARALKRTLESVFANPVSAHLARTNPTTPIVIEVDRVEDGLQTSVTLLQQAEPCVAWRPSLNERNHAKILDILTEYAEDLIKNLPGGPDEAFCYSSESLSAHNPDDHLHALQPAEQIRDLLKGIVNHRLDLEDERLRTATQNVNRTKRVRPIDTGIDGAPNLRDIFAADDINAFLDDLFSRAAARGYDAPYRIQSPGTVAGLLFRCIVLGYTADPLAEERHWLVLYDNGYPFTHTDLPSWEPPLESTDLAEILRERSLNHVFLRGRHVEVLVNPYLGTCMDVDAVTGAAKALQCALYPIDDPGEAEAVLLARLTAKRPMEPFGPVVFIKRNTSGSGLKQTLDLRHGESIDFTLANTLECPPALRERLNDAGL